MWRNWMWEVFVFRLFIRELHDEPLYSCISKSSKSPELRRAVSKTNVKDIHSSYFHTGSWLGLDISIPWHRFQLLLKYPQMIGVISPLGSLWSSSRGMSLTSLARTYLRDILVRNHFSWLHVIGITSGTAHSTNFSGFKFRNIVSVILLHQNKPVSWLWHCWQWLHLFPWLRNKK